MGILPLFVLIASPFIGSFLALLAFRLPENEDVVFRASHCRSCKAELGVKDLIPIASYFVLRGKCAHCGARIPIAYPLIELGAVLVAVSAIFVANGWLLAVTCLFGWALLTLAATDMRALVLPNVMTLPLIAAGLAVAAALPGRPFLDHAIGAAAGGLVLWLIAWLYARLRGRRGLGMGDVKLYAAAGAWLGWQALPFVMLLASVLALIGAFALRFGGAKVTEETKLPFGAALAAAIYILWLASLPSASLS